MKDRKTGQLIAALALIVVVNIALWRAVARRWTAPVADPRPIVVEEEPGEDTPVQPELPSAPAPTPKAEAPKGEEGIVIAAHDLDIPWELVFLPDGGMLVTERPGRLRKLGPDGFVIEIKGIKHVGEGGLLGLALHPKFAESGMLYLYQTTSTKLGTRNRIVRYRLDGERLVDGTTIIEGIPGASNHDGGRIVFGPDGKLWAGTGDAGNADLAQDTKSLAGKILRLNDDGTIPDDNPFGNAVWSYGHRNVQGLAFDEGGRLWATEHGPSGAGTGYDELNFIEKGKNYGWPIIKGDEAKEGMIMPIIHSGSKDTWAPSGVTTVGRSILFAGLRGEAIFEVRFEGGPRLIEHFRGVYGRLRSVSVGPDGLIYVLTNNTDGRGTPRTGDDKILRMRPAELGL
jgi:glucose/arabinose dehydrogenase